ncbi:MAG: endonuclease/exonuclease/phosphatase family protein [Bacteroidetes bacterium]|nr:endonuclease/exonuclease/phosphatase family protein [Bacteroidota bacterium]
MKNKYLMIALIVISFNVFNYSYSQTIKLITYNIRYDNSGDGLNAWSNRKDFFCNQLKFYAPDIFGIQEGLENQINYIDSSLQVYNYVGVGRDDGKKKGEHSAIFYNTKKFILIQQSTFWLSETPDIISKGWDAALNRICTYALFETKDSKQKFWVFNTHFDHIGELARTNSAKLIVEKIKSLNKSNYPVFLMGDFNSESNTDAYKHIITYLSDAKNVAKDLVFGPEGSFNGFQFTKPVTERIDFIFVDTRKIEVKNFAILSDSKDCRYPSDHLPVYIEATFKNKK